MHKPQKYMYLLISLLIAFNIFLPVKAIVIEDQYCDDAVITAADDWWYIKAHAPVSQTFTPTKTKLTSIEVALEGGNPVPAVVTMELSVVGGGVAGTQMAVVAEPVSWVEFVFPAAITLDTTRQYKITLTTASNDARWLVSVVDGLHPVPCYTGGKAFVDGLEKNDQDFGFVTYGFNEATPTPTTPPTATPSKTPTPELIAKPNNLDAEYNADITGVNLSWTPSATAGINGYNIYRSLSATADFVKIASVENGTTEYIDVSNIEPDTTYYYQVKAYKGESESPASTTVDVDVPATGLVTDDLVVTQTPTNQVQGNWGSQFLPFILAGMFLFALIALVLVFLIVKKARDKKKEVVTERVEEDNIKVEKDSEVDADTKDKDEEDDKEDPEPETKEEPAEESTESEE